ncbi:MAG: hypothetical protein ABSF22_20090 [Bryobacteraceae bacterium]|jgi:hypothetical protein
MAKNLWGDLSSLEIVRTPKTILDEQAVLLTKATEGILAGVVEDETRSRSFRYSLNVVVPALNNYKYEILEVLHPLEIYPVRLLCERPKVDATIKSEEDFEDVIAKVLSSPEVRSVLSRLKSQVA